MKQRTVANSIRKEFEKGKATGRQPTCPYCGIPLEIYYTQYESITWKWNAKKRIYEKEITDIDPAIPVCASCETEDWDFINSGLLSF
jgi:hypothetical protein